MRFIFSDQEKKIMYWEVVEMRPQQASVLACVVLAGTSEGLAGPRVLEEACCRCCSTE